MQKNYMLSPVDDMFFLKTNLIQIFFLIFHVLG